MSEIVPIDQVDFNAILASRNDSVYKNITIATNKKEVIFEHISFHDCSVLGDINIHSYVKFIGCTFNDFLIEGMLGETRTYTFQKCHINNLAIHGANGHNLKIHHCEVNTILSYGSLASFSLRNSGINQPIDQLHLYSASDAETDREYIDISIINTCINDLYVKKFRPNLEYQLQKCPDCTLILKILLFHV